MSKGYSIRENFDMTEYNTMGISAKARYFISVNSVEVLKAVLADKRFLNLPKFIIGGGSNILFINDYEGLVIHIDIRGIEVEREDGEQAIIKAGAGENWHKLVLHCVDNSWGGIENLSLIPGLAGAAPIQNIGAYGTELEDVFVELEALNTKTLELVTFNKEACRFAYRDSIFKHEAKGTYIITSVSLSLRKNPVPNTSYKALADVLAGKGITKPTIKQVSDAVIAIRQSKLPDPADIGNTGSFFKNPVISKKQFKKLQEEYPQIPYYPAGKDIKIPAAWLIDQCGWKGKRFGDAGVHKMQALVIVNYGQAKGHEILDLSKRIQASVKEKFGVELVPEVNIMESS